MTAKGAGSTEHKNGKIKFWLFVTVYFILMIADGILTFIGTPDLSWEGNPLVSVFGLGWVALFTANAVVFVLLILSVRYCFIKYKHVALKCEGFKQYCSMLYFKRPDKFIQTLYKFANNKDFYRFLLACFGYVLAMSLPPARLIIVLEWIGDLTDSGVYIWYCRHIRSVLPYGRVDLAVATVLTVLGVIYWIYREYKINRELLENEKSPQP